MGCVCSTGKAYNDYLENPEGHKNGKSRRVPKWLAPTSRKEEVRFVPDRVGHNNAMFTPISPFDGDSKFLISRQNLQKRVTIGSRVNGGSGGSFVGTAGEGGGQVVTGWPSWLTAVAGEAIVGWVPRKAESFEKLDKIGQGTYSSVYRARDLETGKIVALKKVRFANMDPESVQFMAREIVILRMLDHPNVMKLEDLICSRSSSSLYLVFDYMEHDLAGLASSTGVKLHESQIKCYMQQLFHGLEHCHSHGVLHRDIKGSNLLIDNNGTLKIGDFGLSTFFGSEQKQPLTSRVVTLWYRPPELLLGSTDYGVAVDLWSAGCILAELFAAKPIMSGRTEVEQLHKIFKLCGSPSEEYWKNSKLPNSTIFKPQKPYKRCFKDTYKDFPSTTLKLLDTLLAVEPDRRGTSTLALQTEFFATKPFPCDPSSLPKYPPSKELDVKLREEVNRRKPGRRGLGHGHESMSKFSRDAKVVRASGANVELLAPEKHVGPIQGTGFGSSVRNGPDMRTLRSYVEPIGPQLSKYSNSIAIQGDSRFDSVKEPTNRGRIGFDGNKSSTKHELNGDELHSSGNDSKSKRIHCSGPLMPPSGNMDEMLKEHEKQIQNIVRRARQKTKKISSEDR